VPLESESLEQQLREVDRRKDEFLAMLGHELRNPLAPIANGSLLLRRIGGENPDIARLCDMFDRQISTMRRLLDDLLDVSRLNQGKIRFVRQPLDLQPIVQASIEVCRPNLERQHHHLTVELPPQPLRIMGDSTRLSQAVSNLLNNAIKYTPSGGEIAICAEQHDDEVMIRLRDNGIGIDPAQLPRIFELFAQGDQGAGRPQTGLGVGLALVDRIVRAHGGTIVGNSEGRGKGSEFVLTLPGLSEGDSL